MLQRCVEKARSVKQFATALEQFHMAEVTFIKTTTLPITQYHLLHQWRRLRNSLLWVRLQTWYYTIKGLSYAKNAINSDIILYQSGFCGQFKEFQPEK